MLKLNKDTPLKLSSVCFVILIVSALVPSLGSCGEGTVTLVDKPGRSLVTSKCIMCHSLDYISMNSPFLDQKGWEAEIRKMIDVMGAPINSTEGAEILKYLNENYGKK